MIRGLTITGDDSHRIDVLLVRLRCESPAADQLDRSDVFRRVLTLGFDALAGEISDREREAEEDAPPASQMRLVRVR